MTMQIAPAALTRPGADTEEAPSMHEPTYLVPQRLLYAVEAHGDNARRAGLRCADAIRDGQAPARVAQLRAELAAANRDYHAAILLAAAEGATSAELIGYGVSRDLAAELDRGALR